MFIETDILTAILDLQLMKDYLKFDTNFESIEPVLTSFLENFRKFEFTKSIYNLTPILSGLSRFKAFFFGKFSKILNSLFVFIETDILTAILDL